MPRPLIALLLIAGIAAPAAAEIVPDLYRGAAIVTGQDNPAERRRGVRAALAEVLVKVSGDDRLADEARLAPVVERAEDAVADLAYEDRKQGVQISDEQGTRDRSFVLSVDFDPARIDGLLAGLGNRPWPADRPRVLVLLAVEDTVGRFVLGEQSARGYGQREVIRALARRRGVPLVLPVMARAEQLSLTYDMVAERRRLAPDALQTAYGARALLLGTMILTPRGVWDTGWTLLYGGGETGWRIDGTTFDRAIAVGVGRSARILAGLE